MLKKFKLNNIEVDIERNSITIDSQKASIEPRAMEVLAYLATRPKEVVAQELLFEKLWPDTTFSPGSVQRCIAQLRKVLKDDAKKPTYILTHPKRGYSLEITPEIPVENNTYRKWLGIVGLLILVAAAVKMVFPSITNASFSGRIAPITSTANFDFSPNYSATGNSLAFIRQTKTSNEIVVKDVDSGLEQVLVSSPSDYQSLTWSFNNDNLYFIVRDEHFEWVGQIPSDGGTVSRLFTINKPNRIWKVVDDKQSLYYLVVKETVNDFAKSQLIRRNKVSGEQVIMLESSNLFIPYRLAMSFDRNKLALAGEAATGDLEIRLLSLRDGELSKPIHKMSLGFTEISWHPSGEAILLHRENQLFTINLDGVVEDLPYLGYQRIFNPVFHPDGTALAAAHTNYDTDLIEIGKQLVTDRTLVDSSGQDHLARYSPSGRDIAFVSHRAGRAQIYLYRNGQQHLINDNTQNHTIYRAPVWSQNGEKIFYSLGRTLYEYSVADKNNITRAMPEQFIGVLDAYSDESNILIATRRENNILFERFDLSLEDSTPLAKSGSNYYARLDDKGKLVFFSNDCLYWGGSAINISEHQPLNSIVIPIGEKIIFQSNDDILSFDGVNFEVIHENQKNRTKLLVDAHTNDQLMFVVASNDNAVIVEIR
jgi:DNA-binding winged helix-turn-helix (wHTH) protein/Tol biopolymer transport system component